MDRTTVVLPPGLKFQAQQLAHQKHISLAELIRRALECQIEKLTEDKESELFFKDRNFFEGQAPADLSVNHDDYLY